MDAEKIMSLVRIFLIMVGAVTAGWGAYDMITGDGQQNSMGVKKLIGGLGFAALIGVIFTMAINEYKSSGAMTNMVQLPISGLFSRFF